jgi:succinate dehydrogenase / fumarate reductase membrane anchor subunit
MVANVTNFGRSGLYDWMVQRVSAVILAVYIIFILGFFLIHPDLDYVQWRNLFQSTSVKIFSLLTLLSLAAHAWIGLWTISTDYIKSMGFRFAFQAICGLANFAYVVWGVQILWGV